MMLYHFFFLFLIDYHRLIAHCTKRPLMGTMVQVQKVPISRAVQVYGESKLNTEHLGLYLEHAKSGGGEVESVSEIHDPEGVIVTFKHDNGNGPVVMTYS